MHIVILIKNDFVKELFNLNEDETQFNHLKEVFTHSIKNSKNNSIYFIKLLDLIFKYKKCFNLCIRKRIKNFQEDVLNIFLEELEDAKIEDPLQVKEFACIVKNEYWSK